jgi:indolepyruvate decarboxylase
MTVQEISQFGRRGLHPIIFVLNNSGYLSEQMLCKHMALAYNDIAAWNYAELPHALGCQKWFTARVNSCSGSTTHSRQPSKTTVPPTSKS